jgi:transposase
LSRRASPDAYDEIVIWSQTVEQTVLSELKKALNTIAKYIKEILNWFVYRISNGVAEGINTKVNQIKRAAYGYKNMVFFKLKILQKCGFLLDVYPHSLK